MKKATMFILVVLFMATSFTSFAQDPSEMKGSMMGGKGMMKKGMMMPHGEMRGMGPMSGMMKMMMPQAVVATEDGGIVVMAGNKLMKFDKNLNLVKEVEIKIDIEGMRKQMKEMMEKCPWYQKKMQEGSMMEKGSKME
jgi:hypothetical protein